MRYTKEIYTFDYDNAGNEVDNAVFTWNVIADFDVEHIINGNVMDENIIPIPTKYAIIFHSQIRTA